jgi:hypothetical protein
LMENLPNLESWNLGELQWNSTLTYNKRRRGKKNKKLGRSNYEQVPIQLQQQQKNFFM